MQKSEITRHHVIARSRGGTWNPDNLIKIERIPHDAVHLLFGNDLPFEIIRGILDRYKNAIDPDAYDTVSKTLAQVERQLEAYNPNCYNPEILSRTIGNLTK